MQIVCVSVRVKPEYLEAFRRASEENARHSLAEPGIARFDVLQQVDDPTRFVLYEAYRDGEAQGRHRATAHYLAWKDTVAPMMAEPRQGVKFTSVFPPDPAW